MKIIPTLFTLSLLLSSSLSLAAPGKVYNWKIAENLPENNTENSIASRLMIKYTKELSNGKLVITTVSGNSTPDPIFNQVKEGRFQMGHTSPANEAEKDINTQFFSSLPFGMITPEMHAWFYEGGGINLMKKVYDKHGLLSFPGGSYDTQMGGWFTKPIKSAKDFNGLRMHINGVASDIIKNLGVSVVEGNATDLLEQMKTGKIHAVEWGGPASDIDMRFAEVASHYYTAWHEPSSDSQFLVNKAAYEALPKNLQYILKTAMRLATYDAYIQTRHNNALKLNELRKKYPKVKIQAFPTNVMIALKRNTNKKINSLAARGGMTAEILASLNTYQTQIRLWTRIGDQAYLNNLGI